ncbi:MAG TPA: hypothetical protein VKM54_23235 [Myxococcota bacterium]|nr:hypothetical protein [Myxococcota bacterium]
MFTPDRQQAADGGAPREDLSLREQRALTALVVQGSVRGAALASGISERAIFVAWT